MHKRFLIIAAVLGSVSVMLGAFGAHALRETLSAQSLSTFETGVRYQFYHVFALALTGLLCKGNGSGTRLQYAGILFIVGIFLFSGSLYLLSCMPAFKWLGAITPLGGLCFIAGWLLLAAGIARLRYT